MKLIAAILVVGAGLFNFSAEWLLRGTRFTSYATWYIEQSFWVTILCLIILWLLFGFAPTTARRFAIIGCIIGALEGLQNGTCRLLVVNPRDIPPGKTVCDFVTDLPVQATAITMYLLIILWSAYRCRTMIRRT